MDINQLCRHFYASRYLPIAYYEGNELRFSAGFAAGLDPYCTVLRHLSENNTHPSVYTAADNGMYGLVECKKTGGCIVLGPAFSGNVTDTMISAFMNHAVISSDQKDDVAHRLRMIPRYTYYRFLNVLAFLHLIVNDEEIAPTQHFAVADMGYEEQIASYHAQESYLARDEEYRHGTYYFEQRMLEYIRQGNSQKLSALLLSTLQGDTLTEGRLADEPLRQAKNIFIGFVTEVGKNGAIPGGLDIEQVYQLIDIYIQECERLNSIEAINNLQFNMVMDFTNRVGQGKKPKAVSEEIDHCMQYISLHINEPIAIDDVAAAIEKSRTYTTSKFKAETGHTIQEYVTLQKLQEAKTLLKYTEKSIAEISDYLCFSSQPYFSNVFKKQYGVTPMAYRRSRKKERKLPRCSEALPL